MTSKKKRVCMMGALIASGMLSVLLASMMASAQPSFPQNVNGRILSNGTTVNGVPNNILVQINNTALNQLWYTRVNAPPIPQLKGSYSAVIDGTNGQTIVVSSWNATHFGRNLTTLGGGTTTVNVYLNESRGSEANVTIVTPLNNSPHNKTIGFNVTANITMLGTTGINCIAAINFTNPFVLNITATETPSKNLGTIAFEDDRLVNWTVVGSNDGATNISVTVKCDSDTHYLEGLHSKFVENITVQNLDPAIDAVVMDEFLDLLPAENVTLYCNATISDNNSIDDIRVVNATFFMESVGAGAEDDRNHHYTNSSCINISTTQFQAIYACGFRVAYFANNGTWKCNVTVADESNETRYGNETSIINELLAISIDPGVISYGSLEVGQISDDVNVSIRNAGNMAFNVSMRAFAPNESLAYLNNSMICPKGNISNNFQRFALEPEQLFSSMNRLNNETIPLNDVNLYQRTNDLQYGNDSNTTHWQLQIPSLTLGVCNGSILFTTELL